MRAKKFKQADFEAERPRLRALAYRMLGSLSEAEDIVQDTWLRFSQTDLHDVGNLGGWLTTVTSRLCLDHLRRQKTRGETPLDEQEPATFQAAPTITPEEEMTMADSVGLALLVVLQRLKPAERVAFVLHDMFDFAFEDIAPIVDKTLAATRQLASRARRRVQGAATLADADLSDHHHIIDAFLAASRGGDVAALVSMLDPNVVLSADSFAAKAGGVSELRGADAVARFYDGLAVAARTVLVDGAIGAVVAPMGRLYVVLEFTIVDGRISGIHAVGDPARMDAYELAMPGQV